MYSKPVESFYLLESLGGRLRPHQQEDVASDDFGCESNSALQHFGCPRPKKVSGIRSSWNLVQSGFQPFSVHENSKNFCFARNSFEFILALTTCNICYDDKIQARVYNVNWKNISQNFKLNAKAQKFKEVMRARILLLQIPNKTKKLTMTDILIHNCA